LAGWGRDLRYGVRMLARRPGASAIAVVALALGIGLTTVMFSIVEGVLLRGLPFDGGDRIMLLDRVNLAWRRRFALRRSIRWRRSGTIDPVFIPL
jgi:hypothetical protein